MKPTESRSTQGRRVVRTVPVDLLVVVSFVLLADAVISVAGALPLLRVVAGLPILFFVPGYVLLAVLFPGESPGESHSLPGRLSADGGLALSTRLALSFGLSVAIVPVLAVALAFTPVGFGTGPLLGLLTVLIVLGAVVGAARRMRLPPETRFQVPARRGIADLASFVTAPGSAAGVALNLLLVASVVVAASGFAYAVLVPPANPEYADYMLLTRGDGGEYVSSGFPTEFTRGQGQEVVVGVANHRDEATTYTTVIEVQRVRGQGPDFRVVERSELDRLRATVGPGETRYLPHQVAPDMAGQELRLMYYFYRGEAPANPTVGTADDHLHLWVNVSLGGSAGAGGAASAGASTPAATTTSPATETPTPTTIQARTDTAAPTPAPTPSPTPSPTPTPTSTTSTRTATPAPTGTPVPTGSPAA